LTSRSNRGGALLTVLWLSAALSAIAFSVATTVRGEIERSATGADGVRGYFLARGALQRALLWVQWLEYRNPDGSPRYWTPGMRRIQYEFPNGVADVELIPESSKLNVNTSKPEDLFRLVTAVGGTAEQASEITSAIIDWRSTVPNGVSEFDQFYLSQTPSFRARHASLEEIEEILVVKGMTPELFHGTFIRTAEGRLQARPGLRDCLSVYSAGGAVDVNSAPAPVLAAIGLSPDVVETIVQMRRTMPFRDTQQLRMFGEGPGSGVGRLMIGSGTIVTLRATARLRLPDGQLSDLRRSVAALVKFAPTTKDAPYHILRWYDQGGLGMGDLQ
jgi:general secretion pathway protein K